MANVAINGLGRIGRAALKIILDAPELSLVAANDVATTENLTSLLRYDTVYGRYEKPVKTGDGYLVVAAKTIRLMSEKDPAKLPWKELKIDLVFECTGRLTRREDLEKHIQAGARKVILSDHMAMHKGVALRRIGRTRRNDQRPEHRREST